MRPTSLVFVTNCPELVIDSIDSSNILAPVELVLELVDPVDRTEFVRERVGLSGKLWGLVSLAFTVLLAVIVYVMFCFLFTIAFCFLLFVFALALRVALIFSALYSANRIEL
mmetsp:Transcript_21531/g.34990  ORF Transcript_21531/g.34990 Transcript_21531/m.34990 type:complete len:112 (-) Transcript_21531:70-405(-)